MADKDARVRLNLAASGFSSSLQALQKQAKDFADAVDEIGENSEKTNRKAGGLFTTLKAGASGAKSAVSELGSHLKSALGMAATLGGALSIGGAIRTAQGVTEGYKDLAFAIRTGTGEAVTWQDVQKDVEATSDRWKRSNEEVSASYAEIFAQTGDLAFTKKAVDSVAMATTASGKEALGLARIAGTLNEKFGVGADGINDAMAAVLELGNKGGITVDDMSEKLGMAGAAAKVMGMQGQAGFQQLIGMMNAAENGMGGLKKSVAATVSVLQGMVDPSREKEIEKQFGIKVVDKSGNVKGDAMDRIFAKTKGKREELAKVFAGPDLDFMVEIGKNFSTAFEATKGDLQTKTAAGIDALRAALTEAGKVHSTGTDLEKNSQERLKDARAKMQDAINQFVKAFEKPEMVDAMNKLAEIAPRVAHGMAEIVEFTAKHPILAAAGAVTAVGVGGAAKGAVGSLAGDAASAVGGAMSKKFMEGVVGATAWGTAGGVLGVAAAGVIGFEVGKYLSDYLLDDHLKKKGNEVVSLGAAEEGAKRAAETGDPRKIAAAKAELQAALDASEKEKGGVRDAIFGGAAKLFDSDYEDPNEVARRSARAQLEALNKSASAPPGSALPSDAKTAAAIVASGPSTEARKIAREVSSGDRSRVAITNEQALASAFALQMAHVLRTTPIRLQEGGGGAGTNGLSRAAGNNSGSTPR